MPVIGTKGVKSEDELGSGFLTTPGSYHVIVKDATEDDRSVIVDFEVLNGTIPGQAGKTLKEYLYKSEKAIGRLQRLALVLDLIEPDGEEREIDFADAIGKQLIIKTKEETYTSDRDGKEKTRLKCEFAGFWRLGHDDVKDVPLDKDLAETAAQRITEGAAASAAGDSDDSGDENWDDL